MRLARVSCFLLPEPVPADFSEWSRKIYVYTPSEWTEIWLVTGDPSLIINGPRTQPGHETRLAKNMYIPRLGGMREEEENIFRQSDIHLEPSLIKIQFGFA